MPQTTRLSSLSATKLAVLATQAYAQVEDVLHAEPIAIIGMGCRFPGGADNPAAYWEILRNGVDAIVETPADRWDADAYYAEDFAAPGKMNTRRGGFLKQIDGFDAAFFGISPREAERMVPQQRLFYTLEAMGKLGEMHNKVFRSIHVDKQAVDREPSIAAWAERQGLDKVKFQEMYNSMGIQAKARRASQLSSGFKIGGVPSIGVNGKYYTDGDLAGNQTRMLQVTEYLIAESRKAR